MLGDDVRLVGVDAVEGGTAPDAVLGGGDVARLDGVVARTAVEAVHGGVPPVADEVIVARAAVDGILAKAVGYLVFSPEAPDLLGLVGPLALLVAVGTDDGEAARATLAE